MGGDVTAMVRAMARQEAAAALLCPPLVETGADGLAVRVRLAACPRCGASGEGRTWAPPFAAATGLADGPVLTLLACEMITARAALPIVVLAERYPRLRQASFETRAVTWREVSRLPPEEALAAVCAAERWVADPGAASGRTLPASTRRHQRGLTWQAQRQAFMPSFLSPHSALAPSLEKLYADERDAAIVAGYAPRLRLAGRAANAVNRARARCCVKRSFLTPGPGSHAGS